MRIGFDGALAKPVFPEHYRSVLGEVSLTTPDNKLTNTMAMDMPWTIMPWAYHDIPRAL